jgi:predicted SAM-dependent methyltransferase
MITDSQVVGPTLRLVPNDGRPLRLNLGGAGEGFVDSKVDGFLCVDLRDVPETDILCDVSKLTVIEDDTVDCIFASQVLEHFPIAQTVDVLKEWRRVLKPGGKLYVSVPDFDVAVKLYQKFGLSQWLQYHLWGDQKHLLNYHYICFTGATLAKALIDAGFEDAKRITKFPFEVNGGAMLRDNQLGLLISLSMEAVK